MSHIALYRAWRPKTFQEIVGQEHITRTLQNALREQRISHAYLFSGPRGTGKTSAAKILARAVNCEQGPAEEPCNDCHVCQRIQEGAVMDVIEIDAASNRGVDEIRDLRDNVKYAPTEARYKVYIVDEVHMLTTEAFNALLKTLEEPPAHVLFILATTEPHRLPATILSRCQRFDFKRVSMDDQVNRLRYISSQEGIEIDEEAIQYIAKLSDGGMRDALSLLDQATSYVEGKITYELVVEMTGGIEGEQFATLAEAVHAQDVGRALQWVKEQLNAGKSADKCLESLLFFYRDLLVMKLVPTSSAMMDRILDVDRYQRVADLYDEQHIFAIIDVLNRYQTEMKYAPHPQLLFEVALMRICTLEQSASHVAPASTAGNTAAIQRMPLNVQQSTPSARVSTAQPRQTAPSMPPSGTSDMLPEQSGLRSGTGQPETSLRAAREPVREMGAPTAPTSPTSSTSSTSPKARGQDSGVNRSHIPEESWEGLLDSPDLRTSQARDLPPSQNRPPVPTAREAQTHEVLPTSASANRATPQTRRETTASRHLQGDGSVTLPNIIDRFVNGRDDEVFARVEQLWDQVIARLKEVKITVSAWLVNGSPVSANREAVLVAFKNLIHRNTTEKPANKQLIEQVIHEITGLPLQLHTMMRADWDKIPKDAASHRVDEVNRAETEQAATALVDPSIEVEDHQNSKLDEFTVQQTQHQRSVPPSPSDASNELTGETQMPPSDQRGSAGMDASPQLNKDQMDLHSNEPIDPLHAQANRYSHQPGAQTTSLSSSGASSVNHAQKAQSVQQVRSQTTAPDVTPVRGTEGTDGTDDAEVVRDAADGNVMDANMNLPASADEIAPNHSARTARPSLFEQEWIREAVQFFGEELVVVDDDRDHDSET